jgi:signal peptidase
MIVPNAELIPLLTEAVLCRGARARLTVTGSSMWPLVRHGDVVEISAVGDRPVAVDDLLLARRDNGSYVLHRVVRVSDGSIYLLGDAQTLREGPLRREQCIAVVVAAWHGDHPLPLTNPVFRLTVRLWRWLTPCRPVVLRVLRVLRRGWTRLTGSARVRRAAAGRRP